MLAHLARSADHMIKHGNSTINFGLLNICSLTGKGHLVHDLLSDHKLNFLCLNETWQHPNNDFISLNNSTPPEFVYICKPRESGRGVGFAIIHQKQWKVSPVSATSFHSFEYSALQLPGSTPTIICTVYRPPKPHKDFLNNFTALLTHFSILSPNLIITGDFNIHMDENNLLTRDFTSCIDSFGLKQHINFPTHSKGHILDLVCCSGITPAQCIASSFPLLDHKLFMFNVTIKASKTLIPRNIALRKINNINLDAFSSAISDLQPAHTTSSPEDIVFNYNFNLNSILNTFAPIKQRSVSFNRSAPWFNFDLHCLKSEGHRLERLFKKTGLTIHKDLYKNHVLHYKDSIHTAKSVCYSNFISWSEGNSKTLFSLFSKITKPPDLLLNSMVSSDYCNSLMSFFTSKISNIHQQLHATRDPLSEVEPILTTPSHLFSSFSLPSVTEILNLIRESKSFTCQLDPLPTVLLKACLPSLVPLTSTIIYSSLSTRVVPATLKTACITPILKKPGADPTNFDDLRPISKLPFISKILEKVVASQLHSYLSSHNLYEQFQSGFRPQHSTETALVKITNDLLMAADSGHLSILVSLDLSAAFDTISHSILLKRLASISICHTSLAWFTSYISDRTQFIQLKSHSSSPSPVTAGVPQGSVLGPLLFIIYLLPRYIFHKYNIDFHCYADDTQLYISSNPNASLLPISLSNRLSEIRSWLSQNLLELNSNKTELLLIGTASVLKNSPNFSINIDDTTVHHLYR
uniref:Reverse transcriptase domain-containing protein n=1 Tax=Nothobranchius furzeri TaxID=105023 RepID=A0A8C6LY00_NOTFU